MLPPSRSPSKPPEAAPSSPSKAFGRSATFLSDLIASTPMAHIPFPLPAPTARSRRSRPKTSRKSPSTIRQERDSFRLLGLRSLRVPDVQAGLARQGGLLLRFSKQAALCGLAPVAGLRGRDPAGSLGVARKRGQ